jgi:hypothetical protein
MRKPTYDVYACLAGNSAARVWRKSYKSEAAAKRYAASITSYGVYGKVEVRR